MTAATATANRPPTEPEIRAVLEQHKDKGLVDPAEVAHAILAPVSYIPEDERIESRNLVWTNLRPTEEARLGELFEAVYDLAVREIEAVEARLREATVAACMTFAAEYPDAPRALEPSNVVAIEDGAALVSRR